MMPNALIRRLEAEDHLGLLAMLSAARRPRAFAPCRRARVMAFLKQEDTIRRIGDAFVPPVCNTRRHSATLRSNSPLIR